MLEIFTSVAALTSYKILPRDISCICQNGSFLNRNASSNIRDYLKKKLVFVLFLCYQLWWNDLFATDTKFVSSTSMNRAVSSPSLVKRPESCVESKISLYTSLSRFFFYIILFFNLDFRPVAFWILHLHSGISIGLL